MVVVPFEAVEVVVGPCDGFGEVVDELWFEFAVECLVVAVGVFECVGEVACEVSVLLVEFHEVVEGVSCLVGVLEVVSSCFVVVCFEVHAVCCDGCDVEWCVPVELGPVFSWHWFGCVFVFLFL